MIGYHRIDWNVGPYDDAEPEITNDPDKLIGAGLMGLTITRVPAPAEQCGCAACRRAEAPLTQLVRA